MNYVLVGDDCSECCYVSNALTLLKLPHQKMSIQELKSDGLTQAIVAIVCKNILENEPEQLTKLTATLKQPLVSWGTHDHLNDTLKSSVHFLKMPFSQYEFKQTLADSANWDDNLGDLNNPIFEKLVGKSQQIRSIKALISQVAQTDTTVLILGESGTGKDIVASCIHHLSDRRTSPFVPINCGAIPGELIESELFGHEKGAFTGALARRAGRFEMAKGGTLFMDEIGDMPLPMQVKLLRVIQERKVERVGGTTVIDVDVRLIAATHKHLDEMIQKDQFREDLFYRLNVFPIVVPSLKDRKEDIPMILDYQLDKIHARSQHRVAFTDEAIQLLCDYNWPGNIRELQNFLERMVILYPDHVIDEKKIGLGSKIKTPRKRKSKSEMSELA